MNTNSDVAASRNLDGANLDGAMENLHTAVPHLHCGFIVGQSPLMDKNGLRKSAWLSCQVQQG